MKRVTLIILLLVSPVYGLTPRVETCERPLITEGESFAHIVTIMDKQFQRCPVAIPSSFLRIVGKGSIGLVVKGETEQKIVLDIADNKLKGLRASTEETRYTLSISEEHLEKVLLSENPSSEFLKEYRMGNMELRANGLVAKTKLAVAQTVLWFWK